VEEESIMSPGQYQQHLLTKYFEEATKRGPECIFVIDQPENDLGMGERIAWAYFICDLVNKKPNQVIVATNAAEFVQVPQKRNLDGIVVDLEQIPATCTPMNRYNINHYIDLQARRAIAKLPSLF